jgi:uncharacterized protein (TIGR02453 family)
MGFGGFGERLVDFYDGLVADNSRAYWTDHRADYEQHVRAPMAALLAELEPEFGAGKIFRPYRDLRFSPDKTPYKTHCGAIVAGCYYVQVDADGVLVAGGYYRMASDQVQRYRVAVDDERRGEDLRRRLERLTKGGCTVAGEVLSGRPRGVDREHPRLDLLRHRSLYGRLSWPGEERMLSPELVGHVAAAWRQLTPLIEWLTDHVGLSDRPGR